MDDSRRSATASGSLETRSTTSQLGSFLDGLVMMMILLVLVQTFLEDWAIVSGWNVPARNALTLSGLAFDVFFTVEFLVRLFYAIQRGTVRRYLTREKGWIDFLASVPLLMFNSGPAAIALLASGTAAAGMLNVLKEVKAIRIARVLRFLRVIKLFRQIKNADSQMAQRHVAAVATISISVLVFALIAYSVLVGTVLQAPGLERTLLSRAEANVDYLSKVYADDGLGAATGEAATLAEADDALLIARVGGQLIFSRFGRAEYASTFGPGDFQLFSAGDVELFFDLRPVSIEHSKLNLFCFMIVVLLVLAFMVIYSPHFALSVTDPLLVMKRGLAEDQYNLEVKVPKQFADDDLFEVAALYNSVYLPLKDRTRGRQESSVLDLNSPEFSDLQGDQTQ